MSSQDKPPFKDLSIGPAASTRTIMFHQAVADRLRLNPTDHKTLLFLMGSPKTAGELAELTGLTTGAMTAAVDRLEKAGYVRRLPDPNDRRRVTVEIIPKNCKKVIKLFEPLARAMAELESQYTQTELELIRGYLNRAGEVLFQETRRLKNGSKSSG